MKNLDDIRMNGSEYRLPIHTIMMIAIMVFVIETAVMFVLPYLPNMPRLMENVIDSTILVMFLIPGLYYFVYLPFVKKMVEIKQNELAKQQANDENRAKSVFLTKMSYELRTPLNEIISLSEVVLEDALVKEYNQYVEPIKRINASAKKLLSLIDDIFDISAIESGRIALQIGEVSVKQLAHELQRQCETLAAKNENILTVIYPENIGKMHTDYIQIKKIFWQLLSNYLQYTTQSQVVFSISEKKTQERHYLVFNLTTEKQSSKNNSIKRLLTYLTYTETEALQKLDVTALGIALVRKLITLLDGSVEVNSSANAPCVITVTLPRYTVAAQFDYHEVLLPAACLPQSKIELSSNKALLITSDERVANTVKASLQQCGLQVRVANNGVAGLRLAQEWGPAIVFLDLLLPDDNGWDVLSLLKTMEKFLINRVIAMSCTHNHQHAIILAVNHYLFTPISQPALNSLIERYCPTPASATVLIINQDVTNVSILQKALQDMHCQTLIVKNATEALHILEQNNVAMVMLDLSYHEEGAFEFIDKSRHLPSWAKTPLVVTMPKIISQEMQEKLTHHLEDMCYASNDTLDMFCQALVKTVRHFIVIP